MPATLSGHDREVRRCQHCHGHACGTLRALGKRPLCLLAQLAAIGERAQRARGELRAEES